VQIHKLAAIDAAGREFEQTSAMSKQMFLVPFALAKAFSNLFSGSVAQTVGRKKGALVGWVFGEYVWFVCSVVVFSVLDE